MDYEAHYNRLMNRAKARASTRADARLLVGHVERHRIVPGCLGGLYEPENIAYLTGEEHFVAHQLLVRLYPGNPGLAKAAVLMAKKCTGNKAYGWLKRRGAQALRDDPKGGALRGRPKTPEHVAKQAQATRGKHRGPLSEEHRRLLSEIKRGKPHSPEHLSNLRAALKVKMAGNTHAVGTKHPPRSEEWRRKQSAAKNGKKLPLRSPEHSAAISAALRARIA